MKKQLLAGICLISILITFLASCSMGNGIFNAEKELTAEEIYETVSESVVSITAISPIGASYGSGFFYKNSNTVITNYHVIENAAFATITLFNGYECDVLNVCGYDREKDIAILNVDYNYGVPVKIRTSELKTGEKVYAIGNSLGVLGGSMSEGIISTANREIEDYTYIQTTVAVTHGNSGGPLIDNLGNVVGIITSGYGDGGLDLNLAIPISRIQGIRTSVSHTLEEIVNVAWLSDYTLVYQSKEKRHILKFALYHEDKKPVAACGFVEIKIKSKNGKTVYTETLQFSGKDFRWNSDYSLFQAYLYIYDFEITPSNSKQGNISFTIYGNTFDFEKCVLTIDKLPRQ